MSKLILALSILSINALAVDTLDEALSKTRAKYEAKAAKKAERDRIKSHYGEEIKRLRAEQKQALKEIQTHGLDAFKESK